MPSDGSKEPAKVFVSYAREDLVFADQLADALKAAGFEPLIDREIMTGGEVFEARLAATLLNCDTVAFVLSPDSVSDKSFCTWEIKKADELAKRVLPVVCRPIGDAVVPDRLKELDYIFFYKEPQVPGSGFGNGLRRLVTALKSDLDWLREHTALAARAAQWDRRQRKDEELIRGSLLAETEKWAGSRPMNAPEISPLQREFLETSRQAEDKNAAAERKRLADTAAAQEAREKALVLAEQIHRQRRRLRVVTALGTLAFTAALASLWLRAESLRDEAERLRDESKAQLIKYFAQQCEDATNATSTLAETTDPVAWQCASNQFWSLYRGRMIILETHEKGISGGKSLVERKMIDFGFKLGPSDVVPRFFPQSSLAPPAKDVREACDAFMKKL